MRKKEIDSKQNNWLYLSIVAIVAIVAIVFLTSSIWNVKLLSKETSDEDLAGEARKVVKTTYANKCFFSPPDGCSYDDSGNISLPNEFIGCGSPDNNGKCKDICGSSWENSYLCEKKQEITYTNKSLNIESFKIIKENKKTPTKFCFYSPPDACTYDPIDPLPKDFFGCSGPDNNGKCKDICSKVDDWDKSYLCYE